MRNGRPNADSDYVPDTAPACSPSSSASWSSICRASCRRVCSARHCSTWADSGPSWSTTSRAGTGRSRTTCARTRSGRSSSAARAGCSRIRLPARRPGQPVLPRRDVQGERRRAVSLSGLAVHQVAARCNRRRLRRSHALEHACRPQPLRGVVKRPHTMILRSWPFMRSIEFV